MSAQRQTPEGLPELPWWNGALAILGGVVRLGVIFGLFVWLFVSFLPKEEEPGSRGDSFSGPTMGTRYNVSLALGDARLEELQAAVDARLAEINRRMSTYDPASELSRFNATESTEWFSVSDETAHVAALALAFAEDSGGAYDPTVGPVVNLWGFGPGERRGAPPADDQIAAAQERVGWRLVEARRSPPALRKRRADAYLDLSSIAKGYASDAISRLLAERGVENSMVEIGGEVVCRGLKPGELPWRIGVNAPDARTGKLLQTVVELRDEALATSGDYANFFEVGGVRYSHTINPQTGRPVTHNTASVTVRAADCMTADALATTLLVMGEDAGYDWALERGVAALFLTRDGDAYGERATPAWTAALETP